MPFPNEFASRQSDPGKFKRFARNNDFFGKGIHAVWGVTQAGKSVLQSIRFDKKKFTKARVRRWLKDHGRKLNIESEEQEHMKVNKKDLLSLATDWTAEALHDHSFDEIHAAVESAVARAFLIERDGNIYQGYYVYKLWPEKVVAKRSYSNNDEDAALYLAMTYVPKETDEGLQITLGEPKAVKLVFVPADTQPNSDMMMAARDVDFTNLDEQAVSEAKFDGDEIQESVQDFTEVVRASLKDATLTEQEGNTIIRGVKILGKTSLNGRTYPKEVQEAALPLFEGIKAYLNHPSQSARHDPREVQDLIGQHRNVRMVGEAMYSDLHLVKTKLVEEVVLPIVRHNSGLVGNSIVARGEMSSDGTVKKIVSARSVDLVAEPATTKGLFEAYYGTNLPNPKEDEPMTLQDVLKDAQLTAGLREHFLGIFKKEREWNDLQEKLAAETKRADTAEQTLLSKEAAEAEKQKRTDIDKLLSEAKIADSLKNDALRNRLYAKKTVEDAKELISSMEEAAASVTGSSPAPSFNKERSLGGNEQPVTEAHYARMGQALQ